MNTHRLFLFFRTLSHLRLKQILYRIWYAIQAKGPSFLRPNLGSVPDRIKYKPLRARTSFLSYDWLNAKEASKGRFRFLNETAEYGADVKWEAPGRGRLWRYNLHYFQYLHPKGGLEPNIGLRLIQHWIDHNPSGTIDAWDPFPISLRLVNWIKYLSNIPLTETESKPLVRSVYQQALWLERRLEFHLLGNHLFKNAKALLFAGLFFTGPDANRWLSKGIKLLHRELVEQILPDGGHFERSPMYHSMILEDCLDLLNVSLQSEDCELNRLSRKLDATSQRMIEFLSSILHPDGQIALFNDAAFGIEAPPQDLFDYYERMTGRKVQLPESECWALPGSGYYVMAPRPGDRMIIDCGDVGPDYQSGHSHCDTLSFEMSIQGKRTIVDSGCCQYEDGSIRKYNRGNAGHNTLAVDGQNQSEVWGAHRCARRARPIYADLEKQSDGSLLFRGAHDGFRRLSGKPIHHRRIHWSGSICRIEDSVEGKGRHKIESRLHIHPDLSVEFTGDEVIIRSEADTLMSISVIGGITAEKRKGWYCPEFGIKKECIVLSALYDGVSLPFEGGWVFNTF